MYVAMKKAPRLSKFQVPPAFALAGQDQII